MMRDRSQLILSFGMLALLLAGGGFLVFFFVDLLRGADPNIAAGIIAALGAAIGVIYNNRRTRLREIEESHRPQKIAVYEVFMDLVETMMARIKAGTLEEITEANVPEDIEKIYVKLRRGLLIWASPGVIKAFQEYTAGSSEPRGAVMRIDAVYSAMRKDLGNSNFGLAKGDLVKLFLKNPAELDS